MCATIQSGMCCHVTVVCRGTTSCSPWAGMHLVYRLKMLQSRKVSHRRNGHMTISPICAVSCKVSGLPLTGNGNWPHVIRNIIAGTSGCFCACWKRESPIRKHRSSTGIRLIRLCWPMNRLLTDEAGVPELWLKNGRFPAITWRSPVMQMNCWLIWRIYPAGPSGLKPCRSTGSARASGWILLFCLIVLPECHKR